MNPNVVPSTMQYSLDALRKSQASGKRVKTLKLLKPVLQGEAGNIAIAITATLVMAASGLAVPFIITHVIDTCLIPRNHAKLAVDTLILLGIFILGFIAQYIQNVTISRIGRRALFNLRIMLFSKLQSLPLMFFNQNKAGNIISLINHSTGKVNQFLGQAFSQLIGNICMLIGAGIFLVKLCPPLGIASLLPALLLLAAIYPLSAFIKRMNLHHLKSFGDMSAVIQEGLNNFKAIVAYSRRDYFRQKLQAANRVHFLNSLRAGMLGNIIIPVGTLTTAIAQLIILLYGMKLVSHGQISIGVLIGFFLLSSKFYFPLRQIASNWTSFQQAAAAFDRIARLLTFESGLPQIPTEKRNAEAGMVRFNNVSFCYPDGKIALKRIDIQLEKGKTYALFGPTGGGKTTIASLMARLYDPSEGEILLDGRDIRSYSHQERAKKIGFVLQEPILFSGTILENIFYGNEIYADHSPDELIQALRHHGLEELLENLGTDFDFVVRMNGDNLSLGQRQIIAFARAILREPELFILDEATANIDTVTEQLLLTILQKLPPTTTKIIIAHRIKTIENADEVFFLSCGEITRAGSLQHAMEMLLHQSHLREFAY